MQQDTVSQTLNLEDALEFIGQEAKRLGADQYDVFASDAEQTYLSVFQGQVKQTDISHARGIGIRLWKHKRPGLASTERMSREALTQAVRDALSHSEITDEMELELPDPQPLPEIDLELFEPELEEIPLDQIKALSLELEGQARAGHALIENVPYAGAGRSSSRIIVQNSQGVRYAARSNCVYAGATVVAAQNGNKKSGGYGNGGQSIAALDPIYMATQAVERAVELLGATPVPSGQYPVVLSNRISPYLMLWMYASCFYAETVQKGQSRLQGKIGEAIAVPEFTLISDPDLPHEPGSQLFDGEGVPTSRHEVVKDGVLQTFLFNLEAAQKANRPSTGNGARGYSGSIGTGVFNWHISQGEASLQELLEAYPRCLYITELEGGASCSAVSGEISIGAQGFLYEGGQRMRPVDQITLNSNFFDVLQSIRGLSNEYSDTYTSVKAPDLLVESMYVAG